MKILIYGINYAPEPVGVAVYTTGLAEGLAARGHSVQVIAAKPYYPGWRVMPGHGGVNYTRNEEFGVDVTRVPHYVPEVPTGARRLLHHASFGLAALGPALARALAWRPQLVLTVAPALLAAPVGRLAAALCGAHSWLHLQDFEVEAAFATGLLADKRLAGAAKWFEKKVLRSFDTVSSISSPMCSKLEAKGLPPCKIVEFRNWADTDRIKPAATPSSYRAEWNIEAKHVALYSGNIANKQGMEVIVDAAWRLAHRQDLTFVVVGEGPNATALRERAAGLRNIVFQPLQPRERLADLLNLASVHLLPQIAGAADLVLPSKLNNMLASGRPVIAMTNTGSGLAREVDGAGLLVPPGDETGLAEAIELLIADPALRQRMGQAARRRAEERWSRDAILGEIENRFERAIAGSDLTAPQTPSP